MLNETTLSFFETHQAQVYTVLSNSGREFYWRPDHHPYELLLHLEEIEHRTTKVRRPQSNGFIKRLHRTLLDEQLPHQGEDDLV
ncbi:transposase (fragment) [Aeromonas salmonicida]